MATLEILTALVKGGMTPVGACAMGGNMMAESGMKSVIAQRGMTKLSDEEYTRAADMGATDFINDGVGYGLCQWTYHTRKANLLDFAKARGRSVGDEGMQVEFCIEELKTEYPFLWEDLRATQDIRGAVSHVCKEYERPAVDNIQTRVDYAHRMFQQYGALLEMRNSEFGIRNKEDDEETKECGLTCGMTLVKQGKKSPEAYYVKALLEDLGYDVLWEGLGNCIRDFQRRKGLDVDGVCGEKTWRELLK